MSTIDDSERLPPMWASSYWWSRSGALLGLASLITGLVMAYLLGVHLGSCGLPNQITNPTLAIEVAGSWDDVVAMVGPCEVVHCHQSKDETACFADGGCKTICPDKVTALAFEQCLDFGFIIIYWLFFLLFRRCELALLLLVAFSSVYAGTRKSGRRGDNCCRFSRCAGGLARESKHSASVE